MKHSFRPKILDIAAFILGVMAVVFISATVYSDKGGSLYVHITGETGEWIEPLNVDKEIEVPGPLGATYVHIENNAAAITDSPCKNKLCIAMGAISQMNQWIACLPNNVFVRIEGRTEKDAIDAAAF